MAKYTIMMSCGHEQEFSLFGKGSDRERKIHYFETQGLCKECYKKKMQKRDESLPFSFNITVLPYINVDNGEVLLFAWFEGNTKPHKDQIKEIGYTWQQKETADNLFGLDYTNEMCWSKIVDAKDIAEEVQKAKSIGVEKVISKKKLLSQIAGSLAMKLHNEWEKKNSAISELNKPAEPELVKGHHWNWKIYGKSGHRCIYLDNEKINLSDKQAEELEKYVAAEKKYRENIQLIQSGTYQSVSKKEREKDAAIAEIVKPNVPDILKGHVWNQRIYGTKAYSVYLDNKKTPITAEQAEEIRKYLKEKEEYRKKVEEIENTI